MTISDKAEEALQAVQRANAWVRRVDGGQPQQTATRAAHSAAFLAERLVQALQAMPGEPTRRCHQAGTDTTDLQPAPEVHPRGVTLPELLP